MFPRRTVLLHLVRLRFGPNSQTETIITIGVKIVMIAIILLLNIGPFVSDKKLIIVRPIRIPHAQNIVPRSASAQFHGTGMLLLRRSSPENGHCTIESNRLDIAASLLLAELGGWGTQFYNN